MNMNMNEKTSVTLLNELLQERELPPPSYTFVEIPEGEILCTVRAAGEKVSVISTSKKLAKRESSNIMLAKLKMSPEIHQTSQTKVPPIIFKCPTPVPDKTELTNEKPSTALLHELLQVRGLPAASYTFEEVQDGQILCTIEAAGEKVKLISTSKKSAKQEGCNIILAKLQVVSSKQTNLPSNSSTPPALETNEKKSSVLLSDWLQTRKLPWASYTYEEISNGLIKCTVQAANETSMGISTSKKLAKEECCNVMLAKLKMNAAKTVTPPPLQMSRTSSLMNLKDECNTDEKPYTTILQEFLQARKLPLPSCTFEEIPGGNFCCTVRAAGESVAGTAASKKQARQEASKILFHKLQGTAQSRIPQAVAKTSKECNAAGPKVQGRQQDNHVGELNEYASKRKLLLPVYNTLSSTLKTGEYIVNCCFMGQQALGKGKSKKEAKQESAKNMLKLYLCDDSYDITRVKSDATNSKKQKKQGKKAALDDKLTKDIQTIVNTVTKLNMSQQTNSADKNKSDPKVQVIINV